MASRGSLFEQKSFLKSLSKRKEHRYPQVIANHTLPLTEKNEIREEVLSFGKKAALLVTKRSKKDC
jgi:hypothetical protein